MTDLPLPTLLSQALVAFTIEFDNEFEHQMPHRTTTAGSADGPWLVSMVMWSNCMRFVGEEGVTVCELEDLARTKTNLNGMARWGYIVVAKPPRADPLIRATAKGRKAEQVWRPLAGVIENRWEARFGRAEIDELRESLRALVSRFDVELPDCLPILGYGLFSRGKDRKRRVLDEELPLAALLSRALLMFAIEFERESDLSLAICANVVRVLNDQGVRLRDLPLMAGVSKESISMAMGVLKKSGVVVVEANVARLTLKGRAAQEAYRPLIGSIEENWAARFGKEIVRRLRESLEGVDAEPPDPYPNGWRAAVRKPQTLPHYPMVLHRGGYPDGS